MSFQQSTKMKPCVKCGCRQCRSYSRYKQSMIRWGNRKFRQSGKYELNQAIKFENLDDVVLGKVGIGFTD